MSNDRIRRVRDAGKPRFRRFRTVDAKIGDDGVLRLVASTDAPVRFGSWREVLVHSDAAIDRYGAHSLLINHNENLIAGTIRSMTITGGQLLAEVVVMPEARLASGVTVRDAVNAGALRGVSIGYDYDRRVDATWDEANRSVTVNKWRLLEVTLTPIPADADAGVRSCPFDSTDPSQEPTMKNKITLRAMIAICAAFAHLRDALTERAEIVATDSDESAKGERDLRAWAEAQPKHTAGDEAARAQELANERAGRVKAERELKLRSLASEHQLDTTGMDLGAFADEAEGLRALLKRKADKAATAAPAGGLIVIADQGDKFLRHAEATMHLLAGTEAEEGAKLPSIRGPMNGKSMLRALARACGQSDADYWSDVELGMWAVSQGALDVRTLGRRDGANKIASQFSNLLANVAHKALVGGMADYDQATWQEWCTQRNVPNFLQVTNAGLASGRLMETPEGEAFPELTQKDGGYNATLGLWGATVSLTWQAIVNDALGGFMDGLRRTGSIAALTVDREVYYKLLQATWTNDLSTSAGLATAANLDKPRAALKAKKSPAGEKMGIIARFLLHDPAGAVAAEVASGAIYGPGTTTAPSQRSRQIKTVESHWIGDTALKTGVLTTDYYLTGNGKIVDTLLVNFLEGVGNSPIIAPFDPGAVAAEKYKVMLPFRATVATHADSDGTTRVTGMQKATA